MPHDLPRRAVLAGISTLPVAFAAASLPMPAKAAPGASADAALIRLANRASRLARIEERLLLRCGRVEETIVDPPRPEKPAGPSLTMTSSGWSDDGREFKVAWNRPFYESDERDARHEEAVAAWEAERARLRAQAGLPVLERTRDAMLDRLEEVSVVLAGMKATTLAGAAAKAEAWLIIDEGGSQADWTERLMQSLVRDVIAIGGAADA